ncbi:hypothetical protein EON67_01105 [archaeon]|nr:MAG: hypothetical protein EON67_01105 [archaeon]
MMMDNSRHVAASLQPPPPPPARPLSAHTRNSAAHATPSQAVNKEAVVEKIRKWRVFMMTCRRLLLLVSACLVVGSVMSARYAAHHQRALLVGEVVEDAHAAIWPTTILLQMTRVGTGMCACVPRACGGARAAARRCRSARCVR